MDAPQPRANGPRGAQGGVLGASTSVPSREDIAAPIYPVIVIQVTMSSLLEFG